MTRRTLGVRVVAVVSAVLVAGAIAFAPRVGSTEAAWSDREYERATFTAGLATPLRNTCSVTSGQLVGSWFASPRASSVTITYSYRVVTLGGATVLDWLSVGSATSFSRSLGLLSLGSYRLEIRADSGALHSSTLNARVDVLTSLAGTCTWL